MAQLEQILRKFEDPKIDKILNPGEVYFLVTRMLHAVEDWHESCKVFPLSLYLQYAGYT